MGVPGCPSPLTTVRLPVAPPFEPLLVLNDTDNSGQTTYAFTTDPLGYPGTPKLVVVVATLQAASGTPRALSSALIHGGAAAINVTTPAAASNGGIAICSRVVTTGGPVDVSLTWSGAGQAGGTFVFILGQSSISHFGVGQNQVAGFDTSVSANVNTPADGVLFMCAGKNDEDPVSFNVGTPVASHVAGTNRFDVGIWQPTTAQTPQAINASWSSSAVARKIVLASWARG